MLTNRVVVCGNATVGKTAVISTRNGSQFSENYVPTDFCRRIAYDIVLSDGNEANINVWDLSGDKRYEGEIKYYFRNVDVVVFVYDVTSQQSFDELYKWINIANTNDSMTKATYVILANKIDNESTRVISDTQGKSYATMNKAQYMEVSAKAGTGLDEFFTKIGELCKQKQQQRLDDIRNPTLHQSLTEAPEPKPSKCC